MPSNVLCQRVDSKELSILAGAGELYVSEIDSSRGDLAMKLGASKVLDPSTHNLALALGGDPTHYTHRI